MSIEREDGEMEKCYLVTFFHLALAQGQAYLSESIAIL